MDDENDSYLYEEFVIFNFELGLRAFAFIGDIKDFGDKKQALRLQVY